MARTPFRLAAAALLAVVGVLAFAAPAFAHNTLIGSNPGNNSSLEAGPRTIELKFDQPVQSGENLNSVVVVGPDGNAQWQGGKAAVNGNVVTVALRDLGPTGVYRIGYRVLSADGHPVSGEVKFTLTKAGSGTPAPAEQTGTSGTAAESSGGVPPWVWIGGAVLLLGVGVVLAMRIGSGQSRQ